MTRPYIETIGEALRQAGDQPVLGRDGAGTTGSELLAAIYRYARALESLGVVRGDLVAMYAPNRSEALALRYATHLLGAPPAGQLPAGRHPRRDPERADHPSVPGRAAAVRPDGSSGR